MKTTWKILFKTFLLTSGVIWVGNFVLDPKVSKDISDNNYRRVKTVEAVCNKYRDMANNKDNKYIEDRHRNRSGVFSLHPDTGLLVCRTGKHGSTSWARMFVQLFLPNRTDMGAFSPFGRSYQVQLRSLQEERVSQEQLRAVLAHLADRKSGAYDSDRKSGAYDSDGRSDQNYFSFFVCRHPIERLASIYRYAQDMHKFGDKVPSFVDFLEEISLSGSGYHPGPGISPWLGLTVPMYRLCNPCFYQYDYVVKMETFNEDARSILTKVGANWVEVMKVNKHSRGSSNYWKELVKDVPSHVLDNLIDKYKPDFQLCGYNLQF